MKYKDNIVGIYMQLIGVIGIIIISNHDNEFIEIIMIYNDVINRWHRINLG